MSVLERKLVRDLRRLWGQVTTIALVLACGIMAMIMMRATFGSLIRSRDAYYDEYRFAAAFARLERAPEHVARRLERLPGVARVYTRVVEEVMLPLPDEPEPVPGRVVSIPDDGPPPLNGLALRSGRWPRRGAEELVVLEQFAEAHGIVAGDRLPVVLNGSLRHVPVVATALSPEYVFAVRAGDMVANPRGFAVLWMPRSALAAAYRMEGAFNDVVFTLQEGASLPVLLGAVDGELARYGGVHATGRDKQLSNFALEGELAQLRSLALTIPAVFLLVAAFLVNVVVSRLVFIERTQIAVLKALGRSDGRIAIHYLGLVALIVALGAVAGIAFGVWSGQWMTDLYGDFFKFPFKVFHVSPALVMVTVGVALLAAGAGALGAVRRVARMPPAEAMRPPQPITYRSTGRWLRLLLGPAAMMIAREILRRPWRFLLSTLGIAMGLAIFVMGRSGWDSFDHLMSEIFVRAHREDLIVSLVEPRPERAVRELERLPGVILAEGERAVGVRFRHQGRWRDSAILGLPDASQLRHVISQAEVEIELPDHGVVMTDKLAEILGVGVGDEVEAEILEPPWESRRVMIAGLLDEPFGLQAYARASWVHRLLGEEPRVTQIALRVDRARTGEVHARLKELPAVIGVSSVESILERFRAQSGQSIFVFTLILTVSAAAIAIGVVYNNARIALSMRGRDLASLRVLGFTRREISTILLGELAVQVLLGIPLGLLLGWLWSLGFFATFDPEAMRMPPHLALTTYGAGAVVALLAGLVSALFVRRRLDTLDLVAVLKASE